MATKKRAGLGRGLSALIPNAPTQDDRAIDVFFDGSAPSGRRPADAAATAGKKTETPDQSEDARTVSVPENETEHATTQLDASRRDDALEANRAAPDEAEVDDDLVPVPGAALRVLDPRRIVPNLRQPRHEFDQEALDELIVSVREFGVLQPIVVRPLADDDPRRSEGDFELIMGERRLRATKASGREEIPAIVRDTDDEDMLRDALLENLHRADLNPLEEASAYRQLLDDFGCTQEQLAERIGRSRPRISNTLRLLNLPVDVQRKVAAGVLSAGHARAILSVGEPAGMTQLADKIINEELSVREAEAAASRTANRVNRPAPSGEAPAGDTLAGYLGEVGEQLGDRLNTRVKVTLRKTKGQITIDFASVADLRRILAELGEESEENPAG